MKKILTSTKDLSREEWLEYRKKGIGGSDAGAICGLNRFRSAIDVWADKTGRAEEKPDSEAMRVGRDLEDYVAKRFEEATGKKVHRRNAMFQDTEHPWMLANVDREVVGENALLECKTANAYGADRWADGQVPQSYEIQCHHYMAVTGADRVYIACLIMGIDFVVRVIERDEDVIRYLTAIEQDFWQKYVLADEMPPADGSEAAGDEILRAYPESDPDQSIEFYDFDDDLDRLDQIDRLQAELKAEAESIKQSIQQKMKDAETAWIGDRKITWKSTKPRETIDTKRLKAEHPEIWEEYKKPGKPSRRFTVSKKKEDKD